MRSPRTAHTLLVAAPGVVLAGFGLIHPAVLDGNTDDWWMSLHIILLPVFPMLGVAQWILLAPAPLTMRWIGRLAAFSYTIFYGALDAIAGIGAGAFVCAQLGRTDGVDPLFNVGNQLGAFGAWSFLLASVILAASVVMRARWRALPGAVILVAASIFFLHSHIYWPVGVLTVLGVSAGLALLSWFGAPQRNRQVEISFGRGV